MMETKKTPLENMNKNNPFSVPEGYFENLTNQILTNLPEKENKKKSLKLVTWKKISSWVYLAAMITGIAFVGKLFVSQEQPSQITVQEKISPNIYTETTSTEEDILLSYVSDYELFEYLSEFTQTN